MGHRILSALYRYLGQILFGRSSSDRQPVTAHGGTPCSAALRLVPGPLARSPKGSPAGETSRRQLPCRPPLDDALSPQPPDLLSRSVFVRMHSACRLVFWCRLVGPKGLSVPPCCPISSPLPSFPLSCSPHWVTNVTPAGTPGVAPVSLPSSALASPEVVPLATPRLLWMLSHLPTSQTS